LGLRRNRNWRPGEKAYYWIPPRKLLGYTQIRRLGGALGDGWGFQISDTARWEETDNASAEQLEYMNGELAAWRGHAYQIPNRFDFAVPPDRPSPVRLGHVQQLIGRFEKLPR
jgi:hypothetical protein